MDLDPEDEKKDSGGLRKRDVTRIICWTVTANLLALGLIVITLALTIRPELAGTILDKIAALHSSDDVPNTKSDLTVSFAFKNEDPLASLEPRKSSLNLTLVGKLEVEEETLVEEVVPDEVAEDESGLVSEQFEEVRAMAIEPILKASDREGKVAIGSFKPISVSGNSDSCVALGHSMLTEAKSSKTLLDVVIETDAITIAKICTSNGAVFLTCRAGQITISPRRPRPDNGC